MLKKVAIFGGTGGVGSHVTEIAVAKGLQAKVLVRDVSKLKESVRGKVEVIEGDVTKLSDVKKTVEGQDAVVVILGTRNDLGATTVLSEGMKNIVSAMKEYGIQYVSVCLSAFLFYEPEKVPAIFKLLNADHERMLDVLKDSGLKWIAVLPPHFTDNPSAKYNVTHGSSPGRTIAKVDLATFLLESLSQPEHYNQLVGIANAA